LSLPGQTDWGFAALASILTALTLWALSRFAARLPHAEPGPRSLHHRAIPRVGGIAVWIGFLPSALLAPPAVPGRWPIWLAGLGIIAAVSLFDDWRGLHPLYRLAAHFLAAALVAQSLMESNVTAVPAWLAGSFVAIMLVWSANLYNFMDGSDGLAGAMGVCGFGAYAFAAATVGSDAACYLSLAAASLAFLAVNVPPARVFMGDVGAVPMGFLAAASGLGGWRLGLWPAWFPLLVFLPFLADATLTLAKRLVHRERVWEAHKSHYYQRVLQMGAGHGGTLVLFLGLMLATGGSALAALTMVPELGWTLLAAWCAGFGALFAGIDYHWKHRAPISR